MHPPKSDVNRLYFPRKEGVGDLCNLNRHLFKQYNWMLKLVKKHEQNKRMYPITSDAKKYLNEINLSTDNISENSSSTVKNKTN